MLSHLSLALRLRSENFQNSRVALICALMVALGLSCNDSDDDKNDEEQAQAIELLPGSIAVDERLLLVDQASDRAFILNARSDNLGKSLVVKDLNPNTFYIEGRKGKQKEALVLSAGLRGVSQPTMLSLLSLGDAPQLTNYVVGEPFDSLLQSEDGKFAMLYYGTGSNELLYNRNLIGVVTLAAASTAKTAASNTASSVSILNVSTPGGEPTQIALSPAMVFGEKTHILATVLSQAYATLVDITNVRRAYTQVQLGVVGEERAIVPEQALFNAARREIYIRGSNFNDLFVLNLAEYEDDFTTSVYQITVGKEPADLVQYGEANDARLLAVSGKSKDVYIVELPAIAAAEEEEETAPELGYPIGVKIELTHQANRALIFESAIPGDPEAIEQRALLYEIGGTKVSFLDLVDAEIRKEQNLETLSISEPISKVIPILSQSRAVILHESSRVDILDLENRKFSVVDVNGSIENAIYNTDLPIPRMWIAPPGGHLLGYVDIKSGKTNEILLDKPLSQLVMMPYVKYPTRSLLVPIQQKDGEVTVTVIKLDNKEPTRNTAVSFSDFPTVTKDKDSE